MANMRWPSSGIDFEMLDDRGPAVQVQKRKATIYVPSHTGTGESDPPKWCVGRRVAAIGGRLAKVPRQAFPGGKWPAAAAQAGGSHPFRIRVDATSTPAP